MPAVDGFTASVIKKFLDDVQREVDTKSRPGAMYGYGVLEHASRKIHAWARIENYKFYREDKLTDDAFRLRLRSYAAGAVVYSQSYEDARWIAVMIKKYWHKDEALPIAEYLPLPPVISAVPEPDSLDNLLILAKYLRTYHTNGDAELNTITTRTEVEILRLLVDRLEK